MAILSCSLQVDEVRTLRNIADESSATATLLAGGTTQLQFKKVFGQDAVPYIGPFSIEAMPAIDVQVMLTDRRTGKTCDVQFRQREYLDVVDRLLLMD